MREEIDKFSWGNDSSQTLELYLEQTKLVCQRLGLPGFVPICNIFPIIDQCSFFTSRIGSDILMNELEYCVIFLT